MLFITRRMGQTIKIGDDITITIAPNKPGFAENIVTIGIDAPKTIRILRGELLEKAKAKDGKAPGSGKESED